MNFENCSVTDFLSICEGVNSYEIKKSVVMVFLRKLLENELNIKNDVVAKKRFLKITKEICENDKIISGDIKNLLEIADVVSENKNIQKSIHSKISKDIFENKLFIDKNDIGTLSRLTKLTNNVFNNTYDLINELKEINNNNKRILSVNDANDNNFISKKQKIRQSDRSKNESCQIGGGIEKNNDSAVSKTVGKERNENECNNDNNKNNNNNIDKTVNKICQNEDDGVKVKSEKFSLKYNCSDIQNIEQAFKSRIQTIIIRNKNEHLLSVNEFFKSIRNILLSFLNDAINKHESLKLNLILSGDYAKPPEENHSIKTFNTPNKIFDKSSNSSQILNHFIEYIEAQSGEFEEKGSGWSLCKIVQLQINLNKYSPICGSSFVTLPSSIKCKNAIVNVFNDDQKCFQWSILSGIHYNCITHNREFVETYKKQCHCGQSINFENCSFPMELKEIQKFEKENKISVNVFGLNEKNEIVGPLHHTEERKVIHVNLLCLANEQQNIFHYCYIHDLSRLISRQLSNYKGKKFICDGCLTYFNSDKQLQEHQNNSCDQIKIILPEKNTFIKFKNWERTMKVFIICNLFLVL